ncbi:pyridoxal-phosphate-dependent aminotransferase family protein [Candidatus Altiarchaeota archaeon]
MESKKLFIPGPVDVSEDVLAAMAEPMMGHREARYGELQGETVERLKKLLYTENRVYVGTCSSTGFMEAAVKNCVAKKCLNVVNGAFSQRWLKIAQACGKDAEVLEVDWGSGATPEMLKEKVSSGDFEVVFVTHNETSTAAMTPLEGLAEIVHDAGALLCVDAVSSFGGVKIEVDKLGIDVLVTGTQKALAVPPGMAITSVSEAAFEKSKDLESKGFYFDYHVMEKYALKNNTASTPSISHLRALNLQLSKILDKETPEKRFKRHEELAEHTRAWGEKKFELFTEEGFHSNTVSCMKNTVGADLAALSKELFSRGYVFSNGYGKLKGEVFRVAHMGDRTLEDLKVYIGEIEEILGL